MSKPRITVGRKKPAIPMNGVPQKKAQPKPKRSRAEATSDIVRAERVAKSLGNTGVAPILSAQNPANSQIRLVAATSVPDIKPAFSDRAVAMTAYSIVLRGIRRGATNQDLNLWQAYRYLNKALMMSINGQVLEGTSFPEFFWELLNAVSPKKPRFKTAQINLTPQVIPAASQTFQTDIQFAYDQIGSASFLTTLGGDTTDSANLFGLVDATNQIYDDALGASSASKLWAFVSPNTPLTTLQDYKPILHNDTSAFATVVNDRGSAWDGVGAIRTSLSAETFISAPILAKFAFEAGPSDQVQGPGPRRGFFQYRPSGGGAAYLGSRATEFQKMREFYNSPVPLIKYINFLRIFDHFSILLCRIQEQAALSTVATTTLRPYPLTSQQAAIMLRQMVMPFVNNDMLFDIDNQENDTPEQPLIPFAPGSSTPFTSTSSPKIPSFLAENIRSFSRILLPLKGNGVIDIIPCLAAPSGNYLNQQYTWGNSASPLYVVNPGETAISLVDGQVNFNNSTRIVCFDGNQLASIISAHNDWMSEASSFTSPLVTLSQEPGYAGFFVLSTTVHYRFITPDSSPVVIQPNVTAPTKAITKTLSAKDLKHIGVGIVKSRLRAQPDPSNETNSALVALDGYTSTINPFSSVWKYSRIMVLPERTLNGPATEDTMEFYRTLMIEPTKIKTNAIRQEFIDTGNPSVYTELQRAIEAANVDVKENFSAKSEWEMDYEGLTKAGKGGFFGSIANIIGGVLGVPAIGQVAGSLGL